MERIVVFLDYANINAASQGVISLQYEELLTYLAEGRFLVEAYAYVPIDPRNEHGRDRKIAQLWEHGYMVTTKIGTIAGESYKCDFDVEITIDLMRAAHTVRPDIVVLCSGDSDFLPVVHELRKMGIRVETASFRHSASRLLVSQSSGFIDLDAWASEGIQQSGGQLYEHGLDEELIADTNEGSLHSESCLVVPAPREVDSQALLTAGQEACNG